MSPSDNPLDKLKNLRTKAEEIRGVHGTSKRSLDELKSEVSPNAGTGVELGAEFLNILNQTRGSLEQYGKLIADGDPSTRPNQRLFEAEVTQILLDIIGDGVDETDPSVIGLKTELGLVSSGELENVDTSDNFIDLDEFADAASLAPTTPPVAPPTASISTTPEEQSFAEMKGANLPLLVRKIFSSFSSRNGGGKGIAESLSGAFSEEDVENILISRISDEFKSWILENQEQLHQVHETDEEMQINETDEEGSSTVEQVFDFWETQQRRLQGGKLTERTGFPEGSALDLIFTGKDGASAETDLYDKMFDPENLYKLSMQEWSEEITSLIETKVRDEIVTAENYSEIINTFRKLDDNNIDDARFILAQIETIPAHLRDTEYEDQYVHYLKEEGGRDDFDEWYARQDIDMADKFQNFLRQFKLLFRWFQGFFQDEEVKLDQGKSDYVKELEERVQNMEAEGKETVAELAPNPARELENRVQQLSGFSINIVDGSGTSQTLDETTVSSFASNTNNSAQVESLLSALDFYDDHEDLSVFLTHGFHFEDLQTIATDQSGLIELDALGRKRLLLKTNAAVPLLGEDYEYRFDELAELPANANEYQKFRERVQEIRENFYNDPAEGDDRLHPELEATALAIRLKRAITMVGEEYKHLDKLVDPTHLDFSIKSIAKLHNVTVKAFKNEFVQKAATILPIRTLALLGLAKPIGLFGLATTPALAEGGTSTTEKVIAGAEFGVSLIPIWGNLVDLGHAAFGRDINGNELSGGARLGALATGVGGVALDLTGVGYFVRVFGKSTSKVVKLTNAARRTKLSKAQYAKMVTRESLGISYDAFAKVVGPVVMKGIKPATLKLWQEAMDFFWRGQNWRQRALRIGGGAVLGAGATYSLIDD